MINEKNWVPWTINICLVVFVIALLYNESSFKDKREIEKVYRAYIEDFIENIQAGYAYSNVDSLKIIKKEDFYIADVIYSRFNLNDENLFTGNTLYEFKKTNDGWKMVSLEGITDFES